MNSRKLILYNNKICPFGMRAWLTLLEKKLEFEFRMVPLHAELKLMEKEGVQARPQWLETGKSFEEIKQIKANYMANLNPSGEVPTIVDSDHVVVESDVVAEYLDDAFPTSGTSLFPKDAFERSRIRHAYKILSSNGIKHHYGLLMNQDPSKDDEITEQLYDFLGRFVEMSSNNGPWFLGETFSYMDIMLMPFYDRFRYLLPHFRDVEYIPSDTKKYPWADRLRKWATAVEHRKSFIQTSQGVDFYIAAYEGYAGERGASKRVK